MKQLLIIVLLTGLQFLTSGSIYTQTHRQVGLRDNTPRVHAFTNARIIVAPHQVLENATLVVRNGLIESVGTGISIPPDAWITNLEGKTIYPGFIEMYASVGLPSAKETAETGIPGHNGSRHWNPQVRSHFSSAGSCNYNEKQAAELRSQGFVLAHTLSEAGIFKGTGSLVKLADDNPAMQIIKADISQGLSFLPSRELGRGYPTAVMGSIALIRQSLYDAMWYQQAHEYWQKHPGVIDRPEFNPALEAISEALQQNHPFVIATDDEQQVFRAAAIAAEFDLTMWVAGSGHEYRRAREIKATGLQMIVPLSFPEKPDVSRPETSINHSLEDLRHWYLAPENPSVLEDTGIEFALTTHGLKKKEDFLKNLRTAVTRGLSPETALAALTTIPAQKLNISDFFGTLEKGKSACFFVADGDIFQETTKIEQVWVQGKKHQVKEENFLAGSWESQQASFKGYTLNIRSTNKGFEAALVNPPDSTSKPLKNVKWENNRLSFTMDKDSLWPQIRFSATVHQDEMLGLAESRDGGFFSWSARRKPGDPTSDNKKNAPRENPTPLTLSPLYPALEYGYSQVPEQPNHVLIRNATVWTQGPEGVLKNTDILVEKGKIRSIGQNLEAPTGAVIIDAAGRHVTPGLIDPHLHTSIDGGVNEVGDAITSETRIVDVLDANNVWIYRLLAGGLTTANLFHGSANPIGGTSAVIKMRHGEIAQNLFMKESKPGLKFALGENVKRSEDRYPNTRMGTEQIIKDVFLAALQYEKDREASKGTDRRGRDAQPFRKNLQLEAVLEVLRGQRLAHVHAYRQDEMIMIMRLAEEFGFRIASFEHTVEGYKIADELREHGAAAIVWTDWSSFKMEAYDAIHQNARMLLDAGVLTSLHSDNTQLSTRMNWEAGKLLRSGISEVEALNMITLYPARILRIDHLTGTLETGKDADFVIWNGHPLSAYTIADQTWVEGRKFFDRETDLQLQDQIKKERTAIINMIQQN